jgi:ADP-glucose pyrophosphorylase
LVPEKIIANYRKEIFGEGVSNVLVMPANIFFNFSLQNLVANHIKSKKACTILCKKIDQYEKGEMTYVKFGKDTQGKVGSILFTYPRMP